MRHTDHSPARSGTGQDGTAKEDGATRSACAACAVPSEQDDATRQGSATRQDSATSDRGATRSACVAAPAPAEAARLSSDGAAAAASSNFARAALATLLAFVLAAATLLVGCSSEDAEDAGENSGSASTQVEEGDADEEDSFVAHGSTFGKSETVVASTDFEGQLTGITVSEWIKNPEGLESIEDVSTLQSITSDDEDVTYTQDGSTIVWQTNGEDVSYTGITDQDLPFEIEYSFTLDGEEVAASELQDVSGTLEVTITYTNLSEETVTVDGEEIETQQPYAFISILVFDTEHAKNVTVEGGQTLETDGSVVAMGVALPGLASILGLDELDLEDLEELGLGEDALDFPESVTITAEVTGFDLGSITTIATNQTLSALDASTVDEVEASLSDALASADSITESLDQLSEGIAAIDEAIATVNESLATLDESFPSVTESITSLQTAAQGIGTSLSAIDETLTSSLAAQADALEQLEGIDTSSLSDEDQEALAAAIADLEASQQYDVGVQESLGSVSEVATSLDSGLGSVVEALDGLLAGYEALEEGLASVNEATSSLVEATSGMGTSVSESLESVEAAIDAQLDRVLAVAELAEDSGAFCGSADDMPANTTFIVTAELEDEDETEDAA